MESTHLLNNPLDVLAPGPRQAAEHLLCIAGPEVLPDLPEPVELRPLVGLEDGGRDPHDEVLGLAQLGRLGGEVGGEQLAVDREGDGAAGGLTVNLLLLQPADHLLHLALRQQRHHLHVRSETLK